MQNILLALYLLSLLFNVYGSLSNRSLFISIFKPFFMPLLIILHLVRSDILSFLLIGGLLAGWLGDIFLIKPEGKRFTGGLASFLIGHIFYIVLLAGRFDSHIAFSAPENLIFILTCLLFGFSVYLYLRKDLGGMKVAVAVYMLFLIAMSFTAFLYRDVSRGPDFYLPFAGSLFFLLSDMLLAFSTFKGEMRFSYSAVILTYGAAQFLITMGFSL